MTDRERQLDAWLDDALARYSDAEPSWGLETRVLANVRAQRPQRWRAWLWVAVGACVAVVIVTGTRLLLERPAQPAQPTTAAVRLVPEQPMVQPPPPRQSQASASIPNIAHVRAQPQNKATRTLAANSALPAPHRLSHQERLLLAYASNTPEVSAMLSSTKKELRPLQVMEVPKIEIKPINIGEEGQEISQ